MNSNITNRRPFYLTTLKCQAKIKKINTLAT